MSGNIKQVSITFVLSRAFQRKSDGFIDIFDLVEKAVDAGDISEKRLNEAAQRVLEMKFACGLLGNDQLPAPKDPGEAYSLTARKIAEKGMGRHRTRPAA